MQNNVFISKTESYEANEVLISIERILEAFGGVLKLLNGKKKVLIKANLVMALPPSRAATTHPEVVYAVAKKFIEAGCDVTIMDSPGGLYNKQALKNAYTVCGMAEAALRSGASLGYDTETVNVKISDAFTKMPVIAPAFDRDTFIINIAKLKTHGFAKYTGAVKNLYGVVPGLYKAKLHAELPSAADFSHMLVDLCAAVSPPLSIIDGVIGMEGAGPTGGNAKKANVIIASQNPYALDIIGCKLIGLAPLVVPTVKSADERGIFKADSQIVLLGDSLDELKTNFVPPVGKSSFVALLFRGKLKAKMQRFLLPFPVIVKDKCIGCKNCATICPKQIIKMNDKKALISSYSNCIQCYCCHEMCPAKAIDMKRMIFKK